MSQAPKRAPRVRRTSDETKALILDAAERVYAKASPDAVGLKEVAREAGVSHALVTHYFGTYRALVEATLERRIVGARQVAFERLARSRFAPGDMPLLSVLVDLVRDPTTARLVTWALLSDRSEAAALFAVKNRGLALIVDGLTARLGALGVAPPRPKLEFAVMAALAMTLGFASGGDLMQKALGHDGPLSLDAMAGEIHAMLRAYLDLRAPSTKPT